MFITRPRASFEDRSPFGDFWFEPISSRSLTGVRVGAEGALRLAAAYACVRILSESFAVLPFRLYRVTPGVRGRRLVTDHWLYRLFARRPNRFQSPFEFREMLQGHLALRGNAYCQIIEDGAGGIAELLPRHPDRVRVELLDNGSWRYLLREADGQHRPLRRDQVWHLRGLSSDGIMGMSPVELQREALASGLSAQEYGNRFFANDAKPTGGWIGTPENVNFADKATRDTYRESVQAAISGANRHKMLVLDRGMKYNEVGMSNKDSQFLEARMFNRTEIAGMFRVPPHMIGDLSRSTFSNIEQQSIDFWQGTMLPWCERWESAIETQLLTAQDEDLDVDFNFRNLMRGDSATRAKYIHALVLDGVLTRNESRELEGYDPIEGLDEPLVPVNERELSDPDPNGEVEIEPEDDDEPPARGNSSNDDEEQASRLAQLAQATAERAARREAATLAPILAELPLGTSPADVWTDKLDAWAEKHGTFLQQALAAPFDQVQAYMDARRRDEIHSDQDIELQLYQAALPRLVRLAQGEQP